ncbi:bifunctional 3-dehydroquinate dehydratase/shikimate dehydrogenase, chloroplastic isoform X2 [Beta vulgaris subsp. vulgaris]|uniref:bifunctional 3-dehydroquinate dehydratase/shikimate dehydrogenase, chloroplastic isoform X2 n=1 Tax=Beta vulgaris subsp. vulgaris TaxID=3555 RepID=UPI002037506B|nr:bifunctional 3-dehydroquinate dehydratase/shikimate dehydrogenase, chloroplastic isoform X2 [Beta vulgaris subsp. vulgaris]
MTLTTSFYNWGTPSDVGDGENVRRNSTLICVPIMAKTVDKMLVEVRKAKQEGADMVELRLDYLNSINPCDLQVLLEHSCLSTLVTIRPTWEGGDYKGDEGVRQSALRKAMELGADYIDVELKVADEFFESIDGRENTKTAIIVSSHNYINTPSVEEIGDLVARIQATGADIVKIATTAIDIVDNSRILQLLTYSQIPMIGIVMGEKGLMSRILSAKYGGFLTFATLEDRGSISAPGQPTTKDLLELYNFRQVGADTKVHGVLGNPISHSKSPHLYNVAFKSVGFNGIYLPLLVDSVSDFLRTYSSPDFVGYSYTIPHKMAGLECCDEVDPIAKAIGAISCMIKRPFDGKLIGYNIDYMGAIAAIEEGLLQGTSNGSSTKGSPFDGKLMVVIGAGGAGKALAYGGKSKGARIVITDSIIEKAVDLASKVGGKVINIAELDDFAPEEGMILANATPIGMQPDIDNMPISKKALKHYSLVFDAIYTPKITKLLREAQKSGATIVYGTEMFINQAFIQFEKFTGLPAPKELMREVLARNT